jgi:biopolymer transport protein ExbD
LLQIVPRVPDENGSLVLATASGTTFEELIAVMDALRGLGYMNIQFSGRR